MSDKNPPCKLQSLLRVSFALLFACVLLPTLTASGQTGATLSGRVTNSKGEPIADVGVSLYQNRDNHSSRGYTTTDANGDYIVTTFYTGTFQMRFKTPSISYRTEFYDNQESISSATNIYVSSGDELSGYDAVLPNSGRLIGTVLDLDANPIANVNVESSYWNGIKDDLQATAVTDSSGVFTVEVGNDNPHNLYFYDPNRDFFPRYYKTSRSIGGSDTVVVGAEETVTITVALSRTHTISGTVVDEHGVPVANVNVSVSGKEGDHWMTYDNATTDEEGRYRFERLGWAGRNYYLSEYIYRLYFSGNEIINEYYQDATEADQSDLIDMTNSPGLFVANMEVSRREDVVENGLHLPQIFR